ncbi:MAG: hypothetical protein IKM08_07160 [Clostridia bacterium]|nr:hypothetical protein [Clostridia bacterium]
MPAANKFTFLNRKPLQNEREKREKLTPFGGFYGAMLLFSRRIAWQAPTAAFSLTEEAAKKKLSKRNGVLWGAAPSPARF